MPVTEKGSFLVLASKMIKRVRFVMAAGKFRESLQQNFVIAASKLR